LAYRLIRKYICQPRLMTFDRINKCKKCLWSELVSNILACFLSLLNSGPENPIQFTVIDVPYNLLQALKKLILLTYLNHFEFFFHCRKQIEVARSQIWWIGLIWHTLHAVFFELRYRSPTCVNRAIVDMNHKSFLMHRLSSRKDRLFNRTEYFCYKIVVVYFDKIWEFVDNTEAVRITYDREHEFLIWISCLIFVIT
jgi:hypothetical protein